MCPGTRSTRIGALRLVVLLLVAAAPAAQPADNAHLPAVMRLPGTDIGAACLDTKSPVSGEICFAFVLGVVQSHVHASADAGRAPVFCLPADLTRAQTLTAIKKHFRRAVHEATRSADQFVVAALGAAWPCP